MPTKRQLDPEIVTVFFPEDGQNHGGINRHSNLSRWWIGDVEYDDLQNFIPQGPELQQTPQVGPLIANLGVSTFWVSAQILNQATYLFALGTNGAMYQIALGGTVTTIAAAGTFSVNSDITNWQSTMILFCDLNASKVYSWNGTTLTTVFTSQPAQFITVYSNRLWMAYQNTVTFTAGGTYNNLGGDGSSFIINESDCLAPIRVLSPYGGNLYIGGYNWIRIYGGLFDTGVPAVLQFQTNTLTDEAGLFTKWSFLPCAYSVYYASLNGIWQLMGSQPAKMSGPVDDFFQRMFVGNSTLSAAFGWVISTPCLMWVLQAADFSYRLLCLIYEVAQQQPRWFTLNPSSDGVNINVITSGVNLTNGSQQIWGIDTGGGVRQIMGGSTAVTSRVSTKLWSFGTRIRKKSIIRAGQECVVTSTSTISLTAQDENLNSYGPDLQSLSPSIQFIWSNNNQTFKWDNAGTFRWTTTGIQYQLMEYDLPITVRRLGLITTMVGIGGVIGAHAVEYTELPADWGV
jgi:hypothetical protein